MKERILIVEDDSAIALGLRGDLRLEGYEVEVVGDGNSAIDMALSRTYDLIILDIGLPGKSGYDVCRELKRKRPALPVLMLTARDQDAEKVVGFEVGADDYVTKPFSPMVLRARIKALLRRTQETPAVVMSFGPFEIDLERMDLRRDGEQIELTLLEFKLLATLIRNRGRVLSRERLLDLVWGPEVVVGDRTVDTHIANLRSKLAPEGLRFIASVRGIGYRFEE